MSVVFVQPFFFFSSLLLFIILGNSRMFSSAIFFPLFSFISDENCWRKKLPSDLSYFSFCLCLLHFPFLQFLSFFVTELTKEGNVARVFVLPLCSSFSFPSVSFVTELTKKKKERKILFFPREVSFCFFFCSSFCFSRWNDLQLSLLMT